jgi:lipopolysaccharide transport system ATP-binding protein
MKCEVRVENATLRYPIGRVDRGSIKELLLGGGAVLGSKDKRLSHAGLVTAFENLSFELKDGERLALLGANGSGKTSLLKSIAGIYPIDEGRIRVTGHIQSLFDIGLGFEPNATGRDNIIYRGMIMGVQPAEIRARQKEIIEFADIGEFIDLPLRSYSAGMVVRLAFAISTYLQGEVLLLDEFLAAGDAAFQVKAQARMQSLVEGARILVLATHSMALAEQVCTRAILLEKGKIMADGKPNEITAEYNRRSAQPVVHNQPVVSGT